MLSLRPVLQIFLVGACLLGRLAAAGGNPTLFVIGDSTARNTAKGKSGAQCAGWGTPLAGYFDAAKVTVANVAHAGQSSRTYFNIPGDWPSVLPRIKPGDFVLLVFGINDGGPPTTVKSRGSIPGLGDETVELKREDGTVETAHTYGWYMSAMATAAREKGAHVYLLTVTTRNIWTNPRAKFKDATPVEPLPADYDPKADRIERGTANGNYTQWTKDLGAKLHLPVLDLTNLCADQYEKMGRAAVGKFYSDHNHTYEPGADFVAAAIVSGLKVFPHSPLPALLSEKGRAVAPADGKYVSANPPPHLDDPGQLLPPDPAWATTEEAKLDAFARASGVRILVQIHLKSPPPEEDKVPGAYMRALSGRLGTLEHGVLAVYFADDPDWRIWFADELTPKFVGQPGTVRELTDSGAIHQAKETLLAAARARSDAAFAKLPQATPARHLGLQVEALIDGLIGKLGPP